MQHLVLLHSTESIEQCEKKKEQHVRDHTKIIWNLRLWCVDFVTQFREKAPCERILLPLYPLHKISLHVMEWNWIQDNFPKGCKKIPRSL
jgi:hypothetical protein